MNDEDGTPLRQGIAESFIGILRTEERRTTRTFVRDGIFLTLLVLLTGLIVDLPNGRLFGLGVGVVALAFLAGTFGGHLFGRLWTARRYHEGLATGWNRWMKYSIACARLDEVHRRVRGKPATRSVAGIATVWTLILFVTLILLLTTIVDGVPTLQKTPVFAAFGVYLGFQVGVAIAVKQWVRQFLTSVDAMMRTGELGVWGVV